MEADKEIGENLYPLVREALRPFELVLGLIIQKGNKADLDNVKRIIDGLVFAAENMWNSYREHEGRLQ